MLQHKGKADYGRDDIVRYVAASCGLSHREASDALNAICNFVVSAIFQGKKVIIPGFGKFYLSKFKDRKFPAMEGIVSNVKTMRFTTSKALRAKLNKDMEILEEASA